MFAIVRLRNAGAHGRRFRATTGTGGLETRPYNSEARTQQLIRMSLGVCVAGTGHPM